MKKILLTSLVLASSLMANCFDVKSIDSFMDGPMSLQCSKSMFSSSDVITTKIAGKEFGIWLVKTPSWDASCLNTKNLKVSLIDLNDNNKTIATKTIGALSSMPVTPYLFKVDNAYKDVKVKIEYGTSGTKINREEIKCPWSGNYSFNLSKISKFYPAYTKTLQSPLRYPALAILLLNRMLYAPALIVHKVFAARDCFHLIYQEVFFLLN